MPHIDIMSLVGSAVPGPLRSAGHLACWFVVVDGVKKAGPFTSRDAGAASKAIWQLELAMRYVGGQPLAA